MSVPGRTPTDLPFRAVVVVASLGGLSTMSKLLEGLPGSFSVPIMFVQHRAPNSDEDQLLWMLQRHSQLTVGLARQGSPIVPGVTVMPAASLVTVDQDLRYCLAEAPTALERGHRGDTLFSSAAAAFGSGVIGVVLTGNLSDGTEGCRTIKRHGGRILVEDPGSARAASMPKSAISTGCVDHVLPVAGISAALVAFTMAVGAADLFAVPIPPWARLSG